MRAILKAVLIISGTMSLMLGIVGIFLPLLPTTPFLLLSATCYLRSSEKLYNWLLNNKALGRYIKNYIEGKGITKKAKVVSISFLWVTIGISSFLVIDMIVVQVLLMIIAICVSVYIGKMKSYK